MKLYKMRAVFRDPKTRMIRAYGKERSFPTEQALYMLEKYPAEWEVVDPEYEVPDDHRRRPRERTGMVRAELADLKKGPSKATK